MPNGRPCSRAPLGRLALAALCLAGCDELEPGAFEDEPRSGSLPGECLEPLPPEPGPCKVQVELQGVHVDKGQGLTEGDLELSVVGSTSGSAPVLWPGGNAESRRVQVGDGKSISRLLGSHVLAHNQLGLIDVCTEVSEIDNGGINGKVDVGRACLTVPISCHMAARTVDLVTPLCMGDKEPCQANGETTTTFRISNSDEDQDDVPNDKDMAPTLCADDPSVLGQAGRAVLVFFHVPDEYLLKLVSLQGTGAQYGVDLDEAANDYEYVSLLLPEPFPFHGYALSSDIKLSEETITRADYHGEPTTEEFFAALRDIVSKGYDVDIIIVGQGSEVVAAGTVVDAQFETLDGSLTGQELGTRLSPSVSGARKIPIRMTYTTASYNDLLVPVWLASGAKASSGPRQFNFVPDNQASVSDKWNNGGTYNVATSGIDYPGFALSKVAFIGGQLELVDDWNCSYMDMPSEACTWDTYLMGEPFPIADYDETLTPHDNILESSYLHRAGDPTMTKWKSPVVW